jgi:hypothetical protein
VYWINLAQDKVIWQAVMNYRVPYKRGYHLFASVNMRFIRRALLMQLAYSTILGAKHRRFITIIDGVI